MYVDPVVQEVRRHGARLAEECGGDVHRMAERLRRAQAENTHRVIQRVDRSGAGGPEGLPPETGSKGG